jgi:hypothetical protein
MKKDPEIGEKFAVAIIEQLALLRAELICQRALLIELVSRASHERRRTIKERVYDKRMAAAFRIAPSLRKKVGLKKSGWLARGRFKDEEDQE